MKEIGVVITNVSTPRVEWQTNGIGLAKRKKSRSSVCKKKKMLKVSGVIANRHE